MPKVICRLENAALEISGVKFHVTADGAGIVSETVSDEQAEIFASIPGYELVDEQEDAEQEAIAAEAAARAAAERAKHAAEKAAAKKPAATVAPAAKKPAKAADAAEADKAADDTVF